jgi:hypothetical protein
VIDGQFRAACQISDASAGREPSPLPRGRFWTQGSTPNSLLSGEVDQAADVLEAYRSFIVVAPEEVNGFFDLGYAQAST